MGCKMTDGVVEFCHQILERPIADQHLWAGSFFELPIMYSLDNLTDADTMCIKPYAYALPSKLTGINFLKMETHFKYTAEYYPIQTELRIESRNCHPGYTSLYSVKDHCFYKRQDKGEERQNEGVSWIRPLLARNSLLGVIGLSAFKDGKSCEDLITEFEDMTMDWVDAYSCPVWPEEANEWILRKRCYDWPSLELIETIISDGCLLVWKPHQGYLDDTSVWRFSFSRAELNLIHSWNFVQIHIYHILRLIKKDVVKHCGGKDECHLKTYHIKTLMFWFCEENPPEFWKEENLETSLKSLLCTLIEWLIEKDCRSYFIPDNNLWVHLPCDWSFEEETLQVLFAIENIQSYIRKTAPLLDKFSDSKSDEITLFVPNKLFITIQLRFCHSHILNTSVPGRQRYRAINALEENDYFRFIFGHLYTVLNDHRNFISTRFDNYQEKEAIVEKIINGFWNCKCQKFEGHTEVELSPCHNGHEYIQRILSTPIGYKKSSIRSSELVTKDDILILKATPTFNLLLNVLNDMSENPLIIVCYAYEANFHYTAFTDSPDFKRHCSLALSLCNQGLQLCTEIRRRTNHWITVTNELLPMVVTRKWLKLFDKHIVDILESYFKSSNDSDSTDFVIHFSPEDYLRYVRGQCKRILDYSPLNIDHAINDLDATFDNNSTRLILKMAFLKSCY